MHTYLPTVQYVVTHGRTGTVVKCGESQWEGEGEVGTCCHHVLTCVCRYVYSTYTVYTCVHMYIGSSMCRGVKASWEGVHSSNEGPP